MSLMEWKKTWVGDLPEPIEDSSEYFIRHILGFIHIEH